MQAPAPFSNPALYNDYYTYDYHVPADLKLLSEIDDKTSRTCLAACGEGIEIRNYAGRCTPASV